jgi:hypothetical protein
MTSILQLRAQFESLATQYADNEDEAASCATRRDEGKSSRLVFSIYTRDSPPPSVVRCFSVSCINFVCRAFSIRAYPITFFFRVATCLIRFLCLSQSAFTVNICCNYTAGAISASPYFLKLG